MIDRDLRPGNDRRNLLALIRRDHSTGTESYHRHERSSAATFGSFSLLIDKHASQSFEILLRLSANCVRQFAI
jgi:hypothetical protein